MNERDTDKWLKWARDERERYKKLLERAQSGKFRTSEIDGSGVSKDNTHEHIAHLKSAIDALNELIGDGA
jgi:hypothetical protein